MKRKRKSVPEIMDETLEREKERAFKEELDKLVEKYDDVKPKIPYYLKLKGENIHKELLDIDGMWEDLNDRIQTLDQSLESDFSVSER